MNNLRVDTIRNNTILEVSGEDYIDLLANEIQVASNYDFPMSQPIIFYRWDDVNSIVVVNDESVINSYYEETGIMSGLDLEPHIEHLHNGEFLPNTTKTVTIEGMNFSPFSTVEISGVENFVNTIFFKSPTKLDIEVTIGNIEGLFDVVVKNDQLHSKDSGYKKIIVKSKTIIDLRTIDIGLLGLEMTPNINVSQDVTKGIRFTSKTSSWNRGVKFAGHTWTRDDDITFEVIFTRATNVLFMIGLASNNLNVASINSAYYKQEIGMFHNNNLANTMYGGGDVTNWSQGIGSNVIFDVNKFYKLKLDFSGSQGYNCSISEVNPDDWDDEIIVHSWTSNCPADDFVICPFVLPQASSGAYYITGFRY